MRTGAPRGAPVLLNPGPVTLSERVRRALLRPDLCHREEEFSELQAEIRERLLAVYGLSPERWTAVLLGGSGTAAVEAMVGSLVSPAAGLLVIENGVYGERLSRIAEACGIAVSRLHLEWGARVEPAAVARLLEEAPTPTYLALVHHETTTGRLNDLARLAPLCREHGAGLLVDAVSSFGGEELEFEDWGLVAAAATANKCLHGVPGACFVILRREALPPRERAVRSVYLDLGSYARLQEAGGTPFTPAVQSFQALAEALRELVDQGGWRARRAHYARLQRSVERGLARVGIRPLIPGEESSVVLRAYLLPDGVTYEALHDGLKRRGFVIYSGQGDLARRIFRISTMGDLAPADMDRFLTAVEEVLGDG
ncbi:MAG: 2-aminoethylphosphonate aminotransferase [Gemmatimonadota bacterium]